MNFRHNIYLLLFLVTILLSVPPSHEYLIAQQPDSVTVKVDSAVVDTVTSEAELDSIFSGSDRREFDFNSNATILYGTEKEPAWFKYQDLHLTAYKIILFGSDSLIAEGIMVEADPDSFPGGFKPVGKPVLTKTGDEPITGDRMVYNLITKKGAVTDGRTQYEGGYYFGENFTRLDEEFIQIKDGYFTTCDLEDEPHFHFRSKQMKMKVKDKVVAKPVVFYIQDIPIMLLPFGVFPLRSGRSSGFILPSYGQSQLEGRFLRGMGYYYAPNDYWDATLLMDFFDKAGVMFRGDTRYSVRYKMRGSVSGSLTRMNYGERQSRRWDLRVNHNQTVDPTLNISVSGQFMSDNSFYKNYSLNRDQRAQRRIYSSARIDKRWEDSPNSLSMQLTRTVDLSTDEVTETLPSLSFNRGAPIYLFKNDGESDDRFYHSFNFTYSSQLENQRSKKWGRDTTAAVIDPISGEIQTEASIDSVLKKDVRSGVTHRMTFTSPQRILRHISVNPSLNLTENWTNEVDKKYLGDDGSLVTEREKGFYRRLTFSSAVSASTKLYGMFNLNMGRLKTLRHVLSPSLSFSYTPDFSDPKYGYFDTYVDSMGVEQEYDRFRSSLAGSTPGSKSRVMSMSLSNLFQARTEKDGEEEKFDFLSINSSTSYNFNALEGTKKWSTISSSIRLMHFTDLSLRTTHDLYKYRTPGDDSPYEFVYDSSKPWNLARLTSVSTSLSFQWSGKGEEKSKDLLGQEGEEEDVFAEETFADTPEFERNPQERFEEESQLANLSIPWDLRMSMNLSYRKTNPNDPQKVLSTSAAMNVQVTKNWKMSYKTNIDLVQREIIYQDLNFYRDMHCWEMSFAWTPPGSSRAGFFIEIRIKDPKLRDIKVRKTDYGGSAVGFIR